VETFVNGFHIHYIDEAPPVYDRTVLLLHGWGAPAGTYRLIIGHLSTYCRVVAPDLPGFGGSEEPKKAYTPADFAAFVEDFAEAVGITEAILIGHSNGGRIAIKLMAEGCRFRITKAVLMDAAGLISKRPFQYYIKVYSFKAVKRAVTLPGIRKLFPGAVEKARKKFGSSDYQAASPVMRQTMSIALKEDSAPLLPKIKAPVLLIWGENDTATPLSDGRKMEKLIPGSGLVILPGAGHFAFAERWGQCSRVLDSFLKG